MLVKAYDFETTGPNPKVCEPLQIGIVDAKIHQDGSFEILGSSNTLIQIEAEEVPKGAFTVHGISKQMTLKGVEPSTIEKLVHGTVLGYNNRAFDDTIARRYGADITRSIDIFLATQRLRSMGLIPKATLTVAYETLVGKTAENAHDALADVLMTLELIQPCMNAFKIKTFTEFLDFIAKGKANVKMLMPFGKHSGTPLDQLPKGYVNWAKANLDLTGDLKASFEAL